MVNQNNASPTHFKTQRFDAKNIGHPGRGAATPLPWSRGSRGSRGSPAVELRI